jgi:hypothetical protein
MAARPLPYSTGRPGYGENVTVWYAGEATIYSPSSDRPGATSIEHLTCPHKHPSPEAAQKCGDQLGRRTIRERNQVARAELAQAVCDIRTAEFDTTDGLWIKFCAGHQTSCNSLRETAAEAMLLDWACPWAS